MVLLAALAGLAVIFVAKFLPETKGVSLEEITAIFEQQADKGRRQSG
jgi:MFS transporter, SP family, arabinose:H+ symporter